MTAAYPLAWPEGFPRAKVRGSSQFKTGLPAALKNVETSLTLFGRDSHRPVTEIVLSSNVTLAHAKPADPGVAVWFKWDGEQRCIAVDRYPKVEDNLQAIHHVLEARRTEVRHGTLELVRASMRGLKALPPPPGQSWREILALPKSGPVSADQVRKAHLTLAAERHPDKPGGSTEAMADLNRARDLGLRECGT